jgi:ribokinase
MIPPTRGKMVLTLWIVTPPPTSNGSDEPIIVFSFPRIARITFDFFCDIADKDSSPIDVKSMTFLVLGNVTLDEAMAAPIWPTPGQTVVVGPPVRDLGGKGANQAVILKRAGAEVRFVAAIGQDDTSEWIADRLVAEGFSAADLIRLPLPTDRSLIFVGAEGENAIASIIGCSMAIPEGRAVAALSGARRDDILVLQGNMSFAATLAACREARRLGLQTVFNPSPMQPGFRTLLPLVDLLVLNESEARDLAGAQDAGDLAKALHGTGAANVVVTLGPRGSAACGLRGQAVAAARSVAVVDTTGAGDTYAGVLAAGLFVRGLAMDSAMKAAAAAAALTIGRRGAWAAFPSAAEIEAIFASVV